MADRRLIAAVILLFTGCSRISDYIAVINGNNLFTKGEYEEATAVYLKAIENKNYIDFLSYNLGNIYYAFGEPEAALKEWEKASETENKKLLFNIFYNKGVLLYYSGDFKSAFLSFKNALTLFPHNLDAKRNLEICLQRITIPSVSQPGETNTDDKKDQEQMTDEVIRILEYIEKKEQVKIWVSGESQDTDPKYNDW